MFETTFKKKMELLAIEDECAPDAEEYFNKRIKEKYNVTIKEIKKNGKYTLSDNELCMQWRYKSFTLEYNGDDPFHRLYKYKETK